MFVAALLSVVLGAIAPPAPDAPIPRDPAALESELDIVALASFWFIALKTNRFWPYWITGWQLIAIFGHVQKLMFSEILARPYELLSMYISYPILFLILYASGSTNRRREAAA